jgi:hypothetical protein
MKRAKKRGKSARNGNAKSPYQKYEKSPFLYPDSYQQWKRAHMAGKGSLRAWKSSDRQTVRSFKEAAE